LDCVKKQRFRQAGLKRRRRAVPCPSRKIPVSINFRKVVSCQRPIPGVLWGCGRWTCEGKRTAACLLSFTLTFAENQSNLRLISFEVSGRSLPSRFFGDVAGLGRVDEKTPH
jgi:hypothetical protein